jgi:tetratricopeptide (TPR) repeat protein
MPKRLFVMSTQASAQDHYRQGCEDLRAGALESALSRFRAAHRLDPGAARYRSYYGLTLGLCERRWEQALELCRSAARDEFFDPVHYHNLARLHLGFGFKAEAIRLLRRGLMIDPDNAEISEVLRTLGVRRRPPLGFLRRENAMNRLIGKLVGRTSLRTQSERTVPA